ncbi:hypothetical protein U1701_07730 [Sphingomonas sp. PB2P19]
MLNGDNWGALLPTGSRQLSGMFWQKLPFEARLATSVFWSKAACRFDS